LVFLPRLRLVGLLALAVLASVGATTLARFLGSRARIALPAALLFVVIDLSLANVRFEPHPKHADAPPASTPALQTLGRLAPGNGHRFLGFGSALVPNVALELGLEDVRAHLLFTGGVRRLLTSLD